MASSRAAGNSPLWSCATTALLAAFDRFEVRKVSSSSERPARRYLILYKHAKRFVATMLAFNLSST